MSRNAFALLVQWLSGAALDEEWESGLHSVPGRAKEAIRAIVNSRVDLKVSDSAMPLDKIAVASASGLLSSLLPRNVSPEKFNSATQLKLGPAQMTEKLREEVIRVLREEDEALQGDVGTPGDSTTNGHLNSVDANGDVEMGDATREAEAKSPSKKTVKLEPEDDQDRDPDLIRPDVSELLPPPQALYKVTDVKREVEAVRDKRKMIRLGPKGDEGGKASCTLPSIVAFTMFDAGEK